MSRVMADIWVKLHVRAEIDPERIEDEDYINQRAADAIHANDVLGSEVWDVNVND